MKKSKNAPFFSVIIPTLNEEKHLPRLLDNLVKQTFKDFEVIIIDAKSKDKTCEKAKMFKNKFEKLTILISHKKNVSYQRNLGAKKANSSWLIFTDADNQLTPNFLEDIHFHTISSDVSILSCLIATNSKSAMDKTAIYFMNLYTQLQKLLKQDYLIEAFICIKSKTFHDLNGYDESIQPGEGGDLLKRAYNKNYKFHLLKKPKYIYSLRRLHTKGYIEQFLRVFIIESLRFLNLNTSKKLGRKLYPMKGGKYYTKSSRA